MAAQTDRALDRARERFARTVVIDLVVRAEPEDWVAHASLNALAVSTILQLAVGRRWPFA